jgi:cysteine-rich repeat protein
MTLTTRCLGLAGVLVLTAGCGGSNGVVGGGPDASLEAGPGGDAQASTNQDGGGIATSSEDSSTGAGDGGASCGDGVVEGAEECDDGAQNGASGDPCTRSCTWVCVQGDPTRGDPACSDGNPCNGSETCQANHTCLPGTPLAGGATCGTGEICNNGLCAQAVCGDGFVTPPEECDDGSNNGTPNDGCTQNCTFVCLSGDPTRDCTPADPCDGQGTCNDTTHLCAPGTPLGDGTICGGSADAGADAGPIEVCKTSTCVPGYCGDGVLEPGEQCDWGAGNLAGSGCETNCTFSCTKSPESCVTTDICKGTNTCTTVTEADAGAGEIGQACKLGAPPAAGTACGTGGKCTGGVCVTSLCGNGVLDSGEQCDFGAGKNLTGSGCEPDCQFSCQKTPTDTCQTNLCAASPTVCTTVPAGATGTSGQKCDATTELAACGDCSSSGVCVANKCQTSRCGDDCIDSRTGETCDPPNGTTCDSSCHKIAAAVCGNGKREGTEQCDDDNLINLDGCDSTCKFEQDQRANSVTIEYTPSKPFCPSDALGGAIGSAAQSTLSSDLSASVAAGTTSIEFKFMGITDLTGTAQSSGLQLGALSGVPAAAPTGVTYSGSNDVDWWYTTTATAIDSKRNPLSLMSASFASKVFTAQNGSLAITISIAGQPATLAISGASIQANVGSVSKPTASTGATPGHLAAENLDPTLESFTSMNNGLLCGNISAASLATVPVPSALMTGTTSCTNVTYSASNHLLDVLVTGCSTFAGIIAIINPTQPDQINPAAPAAGAGPAYTLTADGTSHVVTGCTDKNGASVTLATCLNAAAYSSYFGFTTDRIIAK